MNNYEIADQHFYSESLDVLVRALGSKGQLGPIMQIVYSGNEAYKQPLIEAAETFLNDNFVPCQFDYEKNEVSFFEDVEIIKHSKDIED